MKNGIYKPPQFYNELGVACLRMYNIEKGEIIWKDIKRMDLTEEEILEYGLTPGDVLINRVNSRELVGKAAVIPYGLEPCVYESKNIRLRLFGDQIESKFVGFWFQIFSRQFFNRNGQQTVGMASINQEQVASMPLPIAPINEQRRIVRKIEEFFTRLDAGIVALKKTKFLLKQYRQSVLKHAFEGEITKRWREQNKNHDASQFLLSISKYIKHNNFLKYENCKTAGILTTLNNLTDFTKNLFLPNNWCKTTISEICEVVRGASPRPACSPKYFGGLIPWITVGSLTADDSPYLFSVSEFVTEEGKKRSHYIESDTLLLTNSGATLGVPKITRIGGCINDGSVALLHLQEPIKHFLYYFMTYITKSLRTINQGAAQPNLNTGIVKSIVFPLPPKMEQEKIIKSIEYHFSVISNTEVIIKKAIKQSENLREGILKNAFQGNLVPQDPNDEPAEMLIRKIKEVRPNSEPSKEKRKRVEKRTENYKQMRLI